MTHKNWIKFTIACNVLIILVCIHSLLRVGYSIFPCILIPLHIFAIVVRFTSEEKLIKITNYVLRQL